MELKIKCVNTTTSSDGSQYGKFVVEPLEDLVLQSGTL